MGSRRVGMDECANEHLGRKEGKGTDKEGRRHLVESDLDYIGHAAQNRVHSVGRRTHQEAAGTRIGRSLKMSSSQHVDLCSSYSKPTP